MKSFVLLLLAGVGLVFTFLRRGRLGIRRSTIGRWRQVYTDFSSRRYYNPFSTEQPVFVKGRNQIKELAETPILSQAAVYSDMFNFEAAISTFDHNEPLATRARLYGRVIQTMVPQRLHGLKGILETRLNEVFLRHLNSSSTGWTYISLAPMLREAGARFMCIIMFGELLEQDNSFLNSLIEYSSRTVSTLKASILLPRILKPISKLMLSPEQTRTKIVARLKEVIVDPTNSWTEKQHVKDATILGCMLEALQSSKYWTAERVSQALVGIWFAGSHQPWTQAFLVLEQLLKRPEFVQPLRDEIEAHRYAHDGGLELESTTAFPLLDAFIKETVRHDPADTLSVRRKALAPYEFKHGKVSVARGTIVAVNFAELLSDSSTYDQPDQFDPSRWLSKDGQKQALSTDVNEEWLLWGYGTRQCPGRFIAVYMLKTIIVHLLETYDIRMLPATKSLHFRWETFKLPIQSSRIAIRRRQTRR